MGKQKRQARVDKRSESWEKEKKKHRDTKIHLAKRIFQLGILFSPSPGLGI